MPVLVAQTGPLAGRRFEFDDELVLGRENAAVALADEQTSRRHATIRVVAGNVVIEDLGSTNGTFVDGRRIAMPTKLKGGESIKLGKATFYVEVESSPRVDAETTLLEERPKPAAGDRTAHGAVPSSPTPPSDPDSTMLRRRHEPPEPAVAAPASAPPPTAAPAPATPMHGSAPLPGDLPVGTFSPPEPKRRRAPASRKLGPTLASFATIITTSVALIVYFAGR